MRSFAGTRWLVLGEMKELGDASDELHAEVGRYARQAGIERLLAIGEGSRFSQWRRSVAAANGSPTSTR